MTKRRRVEGALFVALPIVAQILLSFINELYYFRLMAFVMPIFICSVFVYYLCCYKLRQTSLPDISILVGGTYGFGFLHYKMQEKHFRDYALANGLLLEVNGFEPLIVVLIAHAVIYLALGIIIVGTFVFIKVFQQLFSHREEELLEKEDIMEWGTWDDTSKKTQ